MSQNQNSSLPASSAERFQVSSDTIVKSFNSQIALVHIKTKRIHVLNATATCLWKFISAGNSREEMRKMMLEEFSIDEQELTNEIDRLLSMLQTEGLILIQG